MESGWRKYRGEPFLNKQEDVGPPSGHEEHTQHHPEKALRPPEESEARAKRTECRDQQRLWVERATFVVGFFGLMGLLFTLQQTRISTEAVTKQLELSERPWISVDLVALRPLVLDERGEVSVWGQFILKNLGHSPARSARLRYRVVELLDRNRGYEIQHELCVSTESGAESVGSRHVIMPDEQVVQRQHMSALGFLAVREDSQKSGRSLLSLAVVGCVEYEFTFTEGFHQTGFFFDVVKLDPTEPQIWYAIEVQQGTVRVDHVGFKKDPFGSYAY